jgi:hypothetical protein
VILRSEVRTREDGVKEADSGAIPLKTGGPAADEGRA